MSTNIIGGCDQNDWPVEIIDASPCSIYPMLFRVTGSALVTGVSLTFKDFHHDFPPDVACILTKYDPVSRTYKNGYVFKNAMQAGRGRTYTFTVSSSSTVLMPKNIAFTSWPAGPWKPSPYFNSIGNNFTLDNVDVGFEIPIPPSALVNTKIGFGDFIGIISGGCWALWLTDFATLDGGTIGEVTLNVTTT